jgi:hypothetical protein
MQRRKNKVNRKPKKKGQMTMYIVPGEAGWPKTLVNTLHFTDEALIKTNAGQQYLYWRVRMNDAFDPGPLILSGSMSGFNEMAALYRRYLVLNFRAELTFVNNESTPVFLAAVPTDIDQATVVTSAASAINLGEYAMAKSCLLAQSTGMNRTSFKFNINLPVFVGQQGAYKDSLTYSGLNNVSPATFVFFNIAAACTSNFTALGLTQRASYSMRIKWCERQTPNN